MHRGPFLWPRSQLLGPVVPANRVGASSSCSLVMVVFQQPADRMRCRAGNMDPSTAQVYEEYYSIRHQPALGPYLSRKEVHGY
jgi:hypothetical protein